jgi:hypothetical protein
MPPNPQRRVHALLARFCLKCKSLFEEFILIHLERLALCLERMLGYKKSQPLPKPNPEPRLLQIANIPILLLPLLQAPSKLMNKSKLSKIEYPQERGFGPRKKG